MKTIQTTAIYSKVDKAVKGGFTTISAQGSSRSSKTYNILIWLIFYLLHPAGLFVKIFSLLRKFYIFEI
ncbi:hypothetical protein CAPN006_01490 [Capnocytophaga canimorsus]|uniref:hypothetical protein n=1 Tax=Capnocytophaga canimorsus TaxID=28188 RepID=UPI001AC38C35|nr:hypothetical protein [Capnocytophaga canimorsus]GIM55755.1 hypothetical protein CAPN006_01490 [Capnocytophaga canimorsus]